MRPEFAGLWPAYRPNSARPMGVGWEEYPPWCWLVAGVAWDIERPGREGVPLTTLPEGWAPRSPMPVQFIEHRLMNCSHRICPLTCPMLPRTQPPKPDGLARGPPDRLCSASLSIVCGIESPTKP